MTGKASVRASGQPSTASDKLVARLRGTRAGERLELRRRVARLEAEVQECRALNVRLAELTDIVTELLLPVAARDEEKLARLLERYRESI